MSASDPFLNTYARFPLELVRGEGNRVLDAQGRWYLDACAGIAVMALGHRHPRVHAAILDQLDRIWHTSNLFHLAPQQRLAGLLNETFGGAQVFFTNSGAEANECAVKAARKHHWRKGDPRPEFLVLEHAFHGRTMMCLAMTPKAPYQEGYAPLPGEVRALRPEDVPAAVSGRTAAVFVEPVQGEGGCRPVENLHAIREACDRHGALLVYDEIQCGLGRSGELRHDPEPDMRTFSKALGGGLPLGACLVSPRMGDPFKPGDHGSTFGGNPVSCAAGLATLQTILEDDLTSHNVRMGARLRAALARPGVEITGKGLILGAHLGRSAEPVVTAMRERGVIVCGAGKEAVRFVPPFLFGEAEVDEAAAAFHAAVEATA